MSGGIYRIVHTASGKCYVGQAKEFDDRWLQHRQNLIAGRHHNADLQSAWDSGTKDDFEFVINEVIPPEMFYMLLEYEEDAINYFTKRLGTFNRTHAGKAMLKMEELRIAAEKEAAEKAEAERIRIISEAEQARLYKRKKEHEEEYCFDRNGKKIIGQHGDRRFNKNGYDADGFGPLGYNSEGFKYVEYIDLSTGKIEIDLVDRFGYNLEGRKNGRDKFGFDRFGRNRKGLDEFGIDICGTDIHCKTYEEYLEIGTEYK